MIFNIKILADAFFEKKKKDNIYNVFVTVLLVPFICILCANIMYSHV